ncbi:MAG: hypothetical protein ACM3XN_08480 [Chloroflexota bacterium]
MSRRIVVLLLVVVLGLTFTGVAIAQDAATARGAARWPAIARLIGRRPIAASLDLTDEQRATVSEKLATLKSICQQIRELNVPEIRARVKDAIAQIEQAEAANDSAKVEQLWADVSRLMRRGLGGLRIRAHAYIRTHVTDYDSLIAALDSAIARAEARLAELQSGQ